jgi:hypothetical protein
MTISSLPALSKDTKKYDLPLSHFQNIIRRPDDLHCSFRPVDSVFRLISSARIDSDPMDCRDEKRRLVSRMEDRYPNPIPETSSKGAIDMAP